MYLLNIENLTIKFGINKIIDDFSFSLTNEEIVAFLIPNNGGKTSLIKTLSGVILANCGKVIVNDIPLTKRNFKKYILNIGTVFEDLDNQFLGSTVKDELKFPLIHLCYKSKLLSKRINEVSNIVKIDNILDKSISELSNLEKVKVLIASSIIHFPKILLLDDVFRFLNNKEKKEIFKILNNIKSNFSISIIFTTSNINDIIDLNHIIVLADGKKKMEGSFKDIIMQDNELSKIGFNIPIMIDLSRKLQFYNLIDNIYYDVDKVVNKLWK